MKLIDVDTLVQLVSQTGLNDFNLQLIQALENDFAHWETFHKSPRHATHYPHGVIELMPCANDDFYSFKYVNGHPDNTQKGKLCVAAMGLLAEVSNGYPLMISEMTLLTALRTAAITALGAKYLARKNSQHLAIIGTGAQAEFQAHAVMAQLPIKKISFFDIDPKAMNKFERNMADAPIELLQCKNIEETISSADIIVTATAAKKRVELFNISQVKSGVHIHAMGGDCPGKTEFSPEILEQCKVVVEYTPQSKEEGEIQQGETSLINAELWEVITGKKVGRENDQEMTFFDSVGFSLEDFSILKLVYQLALKMNLGEEINLIPRPEDPKNLFRLLKKQ
ncbi:MAG: ornithine cyclodeaminase [Gammaproteobacteria bacterium]|nr:ornithine cyclodeaminase [Gammaproteobacteria bacterium]